MPTPITITVAGTPYAAELNDTPTALAILDVLPLSVSAATWGDEIYFDAPVTADLDETAAEVVELGALGYWPPGSAFCIFYGMTPASAPGEIRPASAVNVIGRLLDDPSPLRGTRSGVAVAVERA